MFASGCTTTHLHDTTVRTASTLTDPQYQVVLDNLAMMALNPRIIPWFVKLDGGSVQISDEIAAEAGLLEALALGSIADSLLGRALIPAPHAFTNSFSAADDGEKSCYYQRL